MLMNLQLNNFLVTPLSEATLFPLSLSLSFSPLPFSFIGSFLFSVRMELCMTNFLGNEGVGRRRKKRNWQPEGGFLG